MSDEKRRGVPSTCPDEEVAVEAAKRIYLGEQFRDVAEALGMSVRTLRRWRQAQWWGEVEARARDAYFDELTGIARATVLERVKSDHWLAYKVLTEGAGAATSSPVVRDEEGSTYIGGEEGVIILPDNGRGL